MKKNLLFIAFLLAFHFLFWQESFGINLAVFAIASVIYAFSVAPRKKLDFYEMGLVSALLISATAVATINTSISIIALFFTTFTSLGYLALRQSSILEGFTNGLLSFFSPKQPVFPRPILPEKKKKPAGILYMRLAFIPLLIFVLYLILFSLGNSSFHKLSKGLFGDLFQMLADLSWSYIFFILAGVFVVRWIFMTQRKAHLELTPDSFLSRKDKNSTKLRKIMGLKHEYLSGMMIFVSLNILFAIVNFIDVKWVWFQFQVPANFNLKEFVHEGVGWLIVTLILSIFLIFYFFRYNLNFYPKNKFLKILGQIWIFQNIILAISVALRTSYYMGFHGLASGRILVLVLITLVLFGLLSLSVKILQQRNTAFVLRVNSTFFLVLITVCGAIHWDKIIANHNLNHHMSNEIDVDNYLNLNPQVYPLIYENLDKVEKQINSHNANDVRWISYTDVDNFKASLDKRAKNYLDKRSGYSLASWSWGDARATQELREHL